MFLVERYIKNIKFKNTNFIKSLELKYLKKYCNNIFIDKTRYIDEKEMLDNYWRGNDII